MLAILSSWWRYMCVCVFQVTLTLRHRTEHKNVGRIMANEDAIVNILKEVCLLPSVCLYFQTNSSVASQGNMINVHVVDFSKMSFTEQMKASPFYDMHPACCEFIWWRCLVGAQHKRSGRNSRGRSHAHHVCGGGVRAGGDSPVVSAGQALPPRVQSHRLVDRRNSTHVKVAFASSPFLSRQNLHADASDAERNMSRFERQRVCARGRVQNNN
jgi:hypothetical protein